MSTIDYSNLFTLFTDGAAKRNAQNSHAGYAFYIPSKNILKSSFMLGTNNQAELTAIREGFKYIVNNYLHEDIPDNTIHVFCDSNYAYKSVNGEFNGKLNKELILECRSLLVQIVKYKQVEFHHIKAHTKKDDFLSLCNQKVDEEASLQASSEGKLI